MTWPKEATMKSLEKLRIESGLTLKALAKSLGTSQSMISQWEASGEIPYEYHDKIKKVSTLQLKT